MTLSIEVQTKRLYTLEEFENLDLPDDENIYELIDGELVMTPPPGDEHGSIADIIAKHIHRFDMEDKLGQIRQATRYKVMQGFAPAPDLAFIKTERLVPVVKGAVPIPPDLAVEIWSPHDLETENRREEARQKIRKYQVGGVPIVWAINPENRTVEVYHPNKIDPVKVLGVDDELDGEDVIPGFKLKVAILFA